MVVDISEHKRAARRIREEEAKFRSLLQQNVAGVVIVRDDGIIGYCNGYFSQLVGRAPEELVGHALRELLPETERPIIAQQLRSQLGEGGAPVQIASTMRALDGSIVEVLVNASKIDVRRPFGVDRRRCRRHRAKQGPAPTGDHGRNPCHRA